MLLLLCVWGSASVAMMAFSALSPDSGLTVKPEKFAFGSVSYGQSSSFVVHLSNSSDTNAAAVRVIPDCSCTVMGSVPAYLKPHEQIDVPVTITWNAIGDITRQVVVRFGEGLEHHALVNISAQVESNFRWGWQAQDQTKELLAGHATEVTLSSSQQFNVLRLSLDGTLTGLVGAEVLEEVYDNNTWCARIKVTPRGEIAAENGRNARLQLVVVTDLLREPAVAIDLLGGQS